MGKILVILAFIIGIIRIADSNCFFSNQPDDPIISPIISNVGNYWRMYCDKIRPDTTNGYDGNRYKIILYLDSFTASIIKGGQFKPFGNNNIVGIFLQNLNIETVVPGAFNGQSNIKFIFINQNAISVISDGIFNSLTGLLILDLSFNRIETITYDAFVGTKLKYLNLNNNRLKSFLNDYILSTIDELRYLYLGFNNITSIDSDMSNSVVTNLTLSNNKIDFINVTLLPRNLTKVDFSFNEISEVEHMGNLKSREILLNSNALSSFKVNDETEIFDISENHIQYLDNDMLGKKLKVLKLASNNISEISSSCFHNLTNLFDLDLSHNNMSQIPLGTFDSLNNLATLNISYNHLIEFPVHQLSSLEHLRILDVQSNQINYVNIEECKKHLSLLEKVNLRNNSWSCKNLLDFIHVLKEKKVEFNNIEKMDSDHVYGISCKPNESSNVLENHNSEFEQSNLFYLESLHQELKNLNNITLGINKELQNLNNNFNLGIKQEHEEMLKIQDDNQLLKSFLTKLYENVTLWNQSWNFSKSPNDKLVSSEIRNTSSSNGVFNTFCIIMLMTIVAFLAIMSYLIKVRFPKPQLRSESSLMQPFKINEYVTV